LFLASPGDVLYERQIAREVIDQVSTERAFRGRVNIEPIAWDKPGGSVPMEAGLTPQQAIERSLPRPAECDLVLVILWSRIGTPLPDEYVKPDGSRYLSGTEWEYEDALAEFLAQGRPALWIYRRTEEPKFGARDSSLKEKLEQWEKVEAFFASLTNPDGSCAVGVNSYAKPDNFRQLFEQHLRDWLTQRIQPVDRRQPESEQAAPASEAPVWTGTPYPGLQAFTEVQAPIFFGRGQEVDSLLSRLADRRRRFLAVVGASGTGKSSLIMAGLLPRLRKGAIPGSRDWVILPRFTPAQEGSPLYGLGSAMVSGCERIDEPRQSIAEKLTAKPEAFAELADRALAASHDWAELLVFVDQLEELVTTVPEAERELFVRLLDVMERTPRVRILVTLRADFAHLIDAWPALVDLRNGEGTYILKPPGLHALREMIERPAQQAGVTLDEGLTDRIIEDTGTEPGSVALMAFTLKRLYAICRPEPFLTTDAYVALDGVRGSIAHQADRTLASVSEPAQQALPRVFRELVRMNSDGTVTRRRTSLEAVTGTMAATELVTALVEARLLVVETGGLVEVAHEKLFHTWGQLNNWITETADTLRLIQKVRLEAADWDRAGRPTAHLWSRERITEVKTALETLELSRDGLDEVTRLFVEAGAEWKLVQFSEERVVKRSVFISYSHADKTFARRIAADLQRVGCRVWIDEGELNVGDRLMPKIRAAIEDMDFVVAVLSNTSVESEWVKVELDLAMNRELKQKEVIVLPIIVDEVELPAFLAGKLYADFRQSKDYQISS
jgi:hypothetical protein